MVDWGKLPDLGAVALLAIAFAAVSRQNRNPVSGLWLTGWILIALHFAAFIFVGFPGPIGLASAFIGLGALAAAGLLFMFAAVPYHNTGSARAMLAVLVAINILYISLIVFASGRTWPLIPAAILFAAAPLATAVLSLNHRFSIGFRSRQRSSVLEKVFWIEIRASASSREGEKPQFLHPMRLTVLILNTALASFLLAFQTRAGNGASLAINALLFTVYFGCCLHFLYAYRRLSTGALITTSGFLAWALVFVIAPAIASFWPSVHLEREVWNLPKYVVAVGMILLLLEQQIEHNKHLALHDDLTGLPNRRLFHDRLTGAIERARRTGSKTALLLIDLDHFKQVNDAVGHHVGDLVLQCASQIFQRRVRRSDTVARTGGDEFSIILEGPTSREDAERVADSLIELLNQPLDVEAHLLRVGASVGIAVFPEDADTADSLRIAADLQMYARKHQSRSRTTENPPGTNFVRPIQVTEREPATPPLRRPPEGRLAEAD
jgi:diguanylate cyclase (GGDEF)-like protein